MLTYDFRPPSFVADVLCAHSIIRFALRAPNQILGGSLEVPWSTGATGGAIAPSLRTVSVSLAIFFAYMAALVFVGGNGARRLY